MKSISDKHYAQYNDYYFKNIVEKRANGLLKFIHIPYKIKNILINEITSIEPKIHRMDFVGEAEKNTENICLILECQTNLPTNDDFSRFFQYVSSLRVLKKNKVELYILCLKKHHITKRNTSLMTNAYLPCI